MTSARNSHQEAETDEESALPPWKGAYICYCGTDTTGRATSDKVSFPQVCLCTDVSGRARCKGCGKKIEKGEVRVGVQEKKFNFSGGGTCTWYHPGCFARTPPARFQHVFQIERWSDAPPEVREEMSALLPPDATAPGAPFAPWMHTAFCVACRDQGEHPFRAPA